MANKLQRTPENVSGRFYVDDTCIDCGMCPETLPSVFKRHDESGYSIVHRQPVTPEDVALALEAKEDCPTESIGDDGE